MNQVITIIHNTKKKNTFPEFFKDDNKVEQEGESFLGIDSRHDVWKQIRGLKTEIRNLEREMREGEKRGNGDKCKR